MLLASLLVSGSLVAVVATSTQQYECIHWIRLTSHLEVTIDHDRLCLPPPFPLEEGAVVHPLSGIGGNGWRIDLLGQQYARNQDG